jgi:DegV family protein with EDD domain
MFQIISDGGCDFSAEEAERLGIAVVPFYIIVDGDQALREGIEITKDAFFKRLASEKSFKPKTSQPSPHDYMEIYTPYLEEGRDLLVVTISSKVSGSNNSARIAAETLSEKYPERTIKILDSLNGSLGQGLIVRELAKMRDAGMTLSETLGMGEQVVDTTAMYIAPETIDYMRRGGRIGPTTALVGSVLNLCPIMQVLDGEVKQLDNVRGKKKALRLLVEALVYALKDEMQNVNLSIGHVLAEKDAATFKKKLEEALGVTIDTPIVEVGAPFGTHTGPGALLVAYNKKYEAIAG